MVLEPRPAASRVPKSQTMSRNGMSDNEFFSGQRLVTNAKNSCTGALSSTLQTTFTLQVQCQRARARPIFAFVWRMQ